MTANIDADIQVITSFTPLPSTQKICAWVNTALQDQLAEDTEVCIRLVDKPEIQSLNQTYRNKDKPTNVLSFPTDIPDDIDVQLLGDIVICPQVVFEEAQTQHKSYEHHFAHMIVHGCLHLLGYDHIEPEEADKMESLEIKLLHTINIPNPYEARPTHE